MPTNARCVVGHGEGCREGGGVRYHRCFSCISVAVSSRETPAVAVRTIWGDGAFFCRWSEGFRGGGAATLSLCDQILNTMERWTARSPSAWLDRLSQAVFSEWRKVEMDREVGDGGRQRRCVAQMTEAPSWGEKSTGGWGRSVMPASALGRREVVCLDSSTGGA